MSPVVWHRERDAVVGLAEPEFMRTFRTVLDSFARACSERIAVHAADPSAKRGIRNCELLGMLYERARVRLDRDADVHSEPWSELSMLLCMKYEYSLISPALTGDGVVLRDGDQITAMAWILADMRQWWRVRQTASLLADDERSATRRAANVAVLAEAIDALYACAESGGNAMPNTTADLLHALS